MKIDHQNIEIKLHNVNNQPFTIASFTENTYISLAASAIDNMDTIVFVQTKDSNLNENTETDFNSALLDDEQFFHLTLPKKFSPIEFKKINNNNKEVNIHTIDNAEIYQSHRNRQPVISSELTQNSDLFNSSLPLLSNITTPLPRLQKQH